MHVVIFASWPQLCHNEFVTPASLSGAANVMALALGTVEGADEDDVGQNKKQGEQPKEAVSASHSTRRSNRALTAQHRDPGPSRIEIAVFAQITSGG
ncbi:hypothetical protein VTH06DRAFT_8222 [Thermothelomyces fergusii]